MLKAQPIGSTIVVGQAARLENHFPEDNVKTAVGTSGQQAAERTARLSERVAEVGKVRYSIEVLGAAWKMHSAKPSPYL